MKTTFKAITVMAAIMFIGYNSLMAQTATTNNSTNTQTNEMKTYLIERDIPKAGELTQDQLKGIAQKSCGVIKNMGPDIQWMQSYVTGNKIFCVYKAKNEELIKEHGKEGGFPVTKITQIENVFGPATANN